MPKFIPSGVPDPPMVPNPAYGECLVQYAKCLAEADEAKFLCKDNCEQGSNDCSLECDEQTPPDCDPGGPKLLAQARTAASLADAAPAEDLVFEQIRALFQMAHDLERPHVLAKQLPPPDVQAQIDAILAQADAVAGGSAEAYLEGRIVEIEREIAPQVRIAGETGGNAPAYPVAYLAVMERPSGLLELRGQTEAFGQYSLFVPRDGRLLEVLFYDKKTRRYGRALPNLIPEARYALSSFNLTSTENFADTDGDQLPDLAEKVVGTDASQPDSDKDGLPDGFELEVGSNPLDGIPAAVGISATVSLPGPALDVSALNDFVAVAAGSAGVAVFRAVVGQSPVLLAQVDTDGEAVAVACSGLDIAVADRAGGLAMVRVATADGVPNGATLVRQARLPGQTVAVAAAGGVAYAGTAEGIVFAVDLATGAVLDQISATGPVHDLAVSGDTLFCLLPERLRAYSLRRGEIEWMGEAGVSNLDSEGITRRKRLFVGDGFAYVTAYPGYDVLDARNPASMSRVGNATDGGPNSFKQIVANGSGLGVAVVGVNPRNDGTHDLWLYDVSEPSVTTRYLTTLTTPGVARALSLYGGQAYVADSDSGLHVINYLAFDTQGVPPTIELSASFPLESAEIEEGSLASVTARVGDDVQVRQVEFYLDGSLVATDGNFSFEHAFYTPKRGAAKKSFTLRARALDTGGNATWSPEFTVNLLPETKRPRLLKFSPADRSIAGSVTTLAGVFNEPLDPVSISHAQFTVRSSGSDGVFGTQDDAIISGGQLSYNAAQATLFLTFATPLPPGLYQCTLGGAVTDLAGNALESSRTWNFRAINGLDSDQDGIPDVDEAALGLDFLNADSNGNGLPDGLEDRDGDGLPNAYELLFGFNPGLADTDGNHINDGDEDTDDDRLTNRGEALALTDPRRSDTDGDGWNDEAEFSASSNPLDRGSIPRPFAASVPAVDVLLPAAGGSQALIVAEPMVDVLMANAGLNTTVIGQPAVDVLLLQPLGEMWLGAMILAQPSIEVLRLGLPESQGAPGFLILAQPEVSVEPE